MASSKKIVTNWKSYIYIHYKKSSGIPFYVGKGQMAKTTRARSLKTRYARAFDFTYSNRNKIWERTARKHGVIVEIFASCINDKAAQQLEKELIAQIGRRDLKMGPLVNLTDGGDGHAGIVASTELRKKRSDNMKSTEIPPRWRTNMIAGRKANRTASSIQKGDKLPDWWKKKISEAVQGENNPQFGKPSAISKKAKNTKTGVIYDSIARAAKEENLDVDILYRYFYGGRNTNPYPHIELVKDGV